MSEWRKAEHVARYLGRADLLPRAEGEQLLLDVLPPGPLRVLDLGTGDGRLLEHVLETRPGSQGVALDFSEPMLELVKMRLGDLDSVEVVAHDLSDPLPDLGEFTAIVSSFVIHHLEHARKRALYEEARAALVPGGVFCNLDHVSSPSLHMHVEFLAMIGFKPEEEDESNRLLDVDTQLGWLREIGFEDVDCYWKWRELALLAGVVPA